MRSHLSEELEAFRREVKTVLDAALSETDAPLALGDLKRSPGFSAPQLEYGGTTKSTKSCRICTGDGSDLGAVNRELALLEQSNAALFTALAQTRAAPVHPVSHGLDARMHSVGGRRMEMDSKAARRLRAEAAAIQERERQRIHDSRRLAEQNKDLRNAVSDLQRQKSEIDRQMEEKRLRREQRKAEARRREEKKQREEAKALREQMTSAAVEATRLRARLKARTTQEQRARAREALWRWRASAAASVAARERRERLAAEAAAASAGQEAARARQRDNERSQRELNRERRRDRDRRKEAERVRVASARAAEEVDETRRPRAARERAARQAASIERDRENRVDDLSSEASAYRVYRPAVDERCPATGARYAASASEAEYFAAFHSTAGAAAAVAEYESESRYRQHTRRGSTSSSASTAGCSSRTRTGTLVAVRRRNDSKTPGHRRHNDDGNTAARRSSSRTSSTDRTRHRRLLEAPGNTETQESLSRLADERRVLQRRVEDAEAAAEAAAVVSERHARASREEVAARAAREAAGKAAAVKAGAAIATALLGRARRSAAERAFSVWARACREARRTHATREAAFRKVVARADRRYKRVALRALQRWRLAAAAAAMRALRQRQKRKSLERGASLVEALLRRRVKARLLAGFQQWSDADAQLVREKVAAALAQKRRIAAVNALAALVRRRRRALLSLAFGALAFAARAAAARERREQGAWVLASRKKRASKALLLTKCWGAWKAFTAASSSSRRLAAAAEEAQRVRMETRRLRMDGLAWACKVAVAAAQARVKARAWRTWLDFVQAHVRRQRAISERVLRAGEQRWRVSRLRLGLRQWKDRCKAARSDRSMQQSRVRVRSSAVMLRTVRTPEVDVARAFRGWARASTAGKVATLKRRQAALILFTRLRAFRLNALRGAMAAWRSIAARRRQYGKRLRSIAQRTTERQRLFLLGKAWSALVSAGGEREAARVRKLGAARAVRVLLASAGRASRHRAWLRWRGAVVGAAARSRLQPARRAALQRCSRGQRLRELAAVWGTLRARAYKSRMLVTGAARIEGTLFRARQRALSRRLGAWRSEALAGAIAAAGIEKAREHRHAGVRLLAVTTARVEQRRLAISWRALTGFVAEEKRAEAQRATDLARLLVMAQRGLERAKLRELVRAWRVWRAVVAERRFRGAADAAKALLEGEKAVLAAEVEGLKRQGALTFISSILERSARADIRRGWKGLRQATQRRAILLRATSILSRSRSQLLRIALHRLRMASTEVRASEARARAGRSVLAARLVAARARNMRPAWRAWTEAVARERDEEDRFAGHGERLVRFAAVLSRVGNRKDRARQRRVLACWRLGVAKYVLASQQAALVRVGLFRSEAADKVLPLAAQPDCHRAGARMALRWLHRQLRGRQQAAWRQWTLATSKDLVAEERENWRILALIQLARELARVVESRRLRILRRSMGVWHRRAQNLATYSVSLAQDEKSMEAGARRLNAVLARAVLRRKARVWARLIGLMVATKGRLVRQRELQAQRDRLLTVSEARSSRRIIASAWRAWKGVWVENKHRGEIKTLRARQGAGAVAMIAQRKDLEALRVAIVLWRARGREARERERAAARMAAYFVRADVRNKQAQAVRCLVKWRLGCVLHGKAVAEEGKASAEAAVRARAILAIFRRRRLHKLGEAFRCLFYHRTMAMYGTREEEARRTGLSRELRGLGRVVARRTQRRVMAAFGRWRWSAAEVGQRSDRALLVSSRRRSGAQRLGSLLAHRKRSALSRAWTLWRSSAASAAVHDGERASADLRVSGARHSAGARLLLLTLTAARRRTMAKTWRVWFAEAKEAADAELQAMEKHFHLARTLTRVERRLEVESLGRVWYVWGKRVREVARLARVVGRVRRSRLMQGFNRWRIACHRYQMAEADTGRASAEAALRAKAISILVKRYKLRQLREGFNGIFEHGAWTIYFSKEAAARRDRLAQGFHVLVRTYARRKEWSKVVALGRWQRFASERRREDDKALLQAARRRAGVKALVSLVSRRENARFAQSWGIWRAGAALAAVHDGERASADQRVFGARRSAGARLLVGVLTGASRRTLAKSWVVWSKEVKAAADAELQVMEKHFHLARTLMRVQRRAQLSRVDRAWRAWREVVRVDGEAELQTLERHFHVAQAVSRVVRRVQERRLLRAWVMWARLAARGTSRVTRSKAPETNAAEVAAAHNREQQQVQRSRRVQHRAGAVTVRGLLRWADSRSLTRSWQTWKKVTKGEISWDARLVGATRLTDILAGLAEGHDASCLRRGWGKWTQWSMAERRRLERKWMVAEAEAREMKAVQAGRALAVVISRSDARLLRNFLGKWVEVASSIRQGNDAADVTPAAVDVRVEQTVAHEDDAFAGEAQAVGNQSTPMAASPLSSLTVLRHKLLGGPPPVLPLPLQAPLDARRSPRTTAPRSPRVPIVGMSPSRQVRVETSDRPTSPVPIEGFEPCTEEQPASGTGKAWWAGDSSGDSSLFTASPGPRNLSGAGSPSPYPSAGNASQHPQHGTPSPSMGQFDDDHTPGSLDLSASPEQLINAFRPYSSDFVDYSRPGVFAAAAASGGTQRGGQAVGEIVAGIVSSPVPSVAYTAESSLVGESVLQSRSDITGVDDDDGREQWSWAGEGQGEKNDVISARTNKGVDAGRDQDLGTPEHAHSGRRGIQPNGAGTGGGGGRGGDARSENRRERDFRQLKSRPYVPGSVHASPLGRCGSWTGSVDDVEQGTDVGNNKHPEKSLMEAFGIEPEPEDLGSGSEEEGNGVDSSSDEAGKCSADLFVARMMVVVYRQAFKRWVLAHRDAEYDLRMMTARKKVAFLRRQQKLRKVVVSALRRQSYAWHVNDTSRAIRKWKEFVRRRRDDARLSLEISRISVASAFSPLSPCGAREHAAGLEVSYEGSEGKKGGVRGASGTVLSYSPQTMTSARRRLWDQAD